MSSSAGTSGFDPYRQNITFLMTDGVTPVTVTVDEMDSYFYYNMASCINYGSQLGASLIMLVVLIVLTRDGKWGTPVFILNTLSLLLSFLRALLLALYFVSPWDETYRAFTGDFTNIPRSAYATSIAGVVIPLLLTITVNMSLAIQAYTVCKGMEDLHRYTMSFLSLLVILLAVGFRFAEAATNSMSILSGTGFPPASIQMGALVTETISIWFFSIIFTSKLGYTLYTRRRNGWKQWSAVRILAAMGGCTMVIPSIFAVLEYVSPRNFPEAGTLALTMVALLLPLSSLWASMATMTETASLNLAYLSGSASGSQSGFGSGTAQSFVGSQHRGPIFGSNSNSSGSSGHHNHSLTTTIEVVSPPRFWSIDRKTSTSQPPVSPTSLESRCFYERNMSAPRDSTELDLEAMGVRIDRSYAVRVHCDEAGAKKDSSLDDGAHDPFSK